MTQPTNRPDFDTLQGRVAIAHRFHHEQMIHMPAIFVFLRQPQPATRESLPVPVRVV